MALSDRPAERHRQVAGLFTERVGGTRSWDAPSPVPGWAARDVVRHLTEWFPGFLASGAGIELPRGPSVDENPVAAWQVHCDGVQAVLDDPETAHRELANPHIGRLPLETAIDQFYTADVFMHTWDLSRATGQDDRLDPGLLCSAPRRDGADGAGYPLLRPVRRPGRGARRRGYPDQTAGFHRPGPVLAGLITRKSHEVTYC